MNKAHLLDKFPWDPHTYGVGVELLKVSGNEDIFKLFFHNHRYHHETHPRWGSSKAEGQVEQQAQYGENYVMYKFGVWGVDNNQRGWVRT